LRWGSDLSATSVQLACETNRSILLLRNNGRPSSCGKVNIAPSNWNAADSPRSTPRVGEAEGWDVSGMTLLGDLLEKYHGGPVQRYVAEMEPFERTVLRNARSRLLSDLRGSILEIGCGLGQSFASYPPQAHVVAIEPFDPFVEEAAKAASLAQADIVVRAGDAQAMDSADNTFDGFVASLVFCSLTQPEQALREARRVLKSGAPARFLEHVRSKNSYQALLQRIANPAWQMFDGAGCNLDRDTPAAIRAAGFQIERVERISIPHPIGVLVPLVAVYARA